MRGVFNCPASDGYCENYWKMTTPLKPLSALPAMQTAGLPNSMTAAGRRFCSRTWREFGIERQKRRRAGRKQFFLRSSMEIIGHFTPASLFAPEIENITQPCKGRLEVC
jgi:hypothetical protein